MEGERCEGKEKAMRSAFFKIRSITAALLSCHLVLLSTENMLGDDESQNEPLLITQQILLAPASGSTPRGTIISQDKENDIARLKPFLSSDVFDLMTKRSRLLQKAKPKYELLDNEAQLELAYMIGNNVFIDSRFLPKTKPHILKRDSRYIEISVLSFGHPIDKSSLTNYHQTDVFQFKKAEAQWILYNVQHYATDLNVGVKTTHYDLRGCLANDIARLEKILANAPE